MGARNRNVEIVNQDRIDPEFGLLGLTDMSWSRAECYDKTWSTFACPRKYKCKYCDHAEDGWTIHKAVGSISHDTLEWTIQNDIEDPIEVTGKLLMAVEKHDPQNKMTDGEISEAREITLTTFNNMRAVVDHISNVIDVERGFRYIIGRGLFLGFIDLIFWDEDEHGKFIHILDYKTGGMDKKTGKPKKKTKKHGQMALYTLAAKHMFPGERIKASLYWLKAPEDLKIDTHEFTQAELDTFEAQMAVTVEKIIEDENYPVTKAPFICKWCDFATEDLCKFGKGAAARQNKFAKKKAV